MQKRRYHDFSFNFFCLTVPKNFVGEHFGVSENFGWRKFFCIRQGVSSFFVENFLSHCADKIRRSRRTLLCFERILVSKSFKQRRGKLQGFVENFYFTGPKKLRQGTILCFRKFLVGKIFLWIRGGGGGGWGVGITIFRRTFCLTIPEYFIREHFGVSEKFFNQKFSCIGGGYHGFV